MSFINKSVIYARKLSVFILFLFVFAIFSIFYFYKFIPGHREEFTERGFRILKQFAGNIVQKNKEVRNNFLSIKIKDSIAVSDSTKAFLNKTQPVYKLLNENVPFSIDTNNLKKDSISHWENGAIFKTDDIWSFHYLTAVNKVSREPATPKQVYTVSVNTGVFLSPVLETRKDLFKSYFLLSAAGRDEKNKTNFVIVYSQGDITFSTELNIDTLFKIQKNSDFANVVSLDISGEKFKAFLCPFRLNEQDLVLAGLVPQAQYETKVRTTPQNFIPIVLIIIILILISLPYIKIFLLSPKEPIGKRDVLFTTLSIFVGSSVIVVISFYLLFEYSSHHTFNNRLIDIRQKIKSDIEKEFDLAGQQLDKYVSIYHGLDSNPDMQKGLVYKYKNDSVRTAVDHLFYPRIYKNSKRVLWVDKKGQTLAKWNPFDFNAGFSQVSGQDYFRMFKQELPNGRFDTASFKTIYAGKSIVTGEYLLYLTRPDMGSVLTSVNCGNKDSFCRQQSFAAVLPFYLNCSEHPVLPPGFGFCVVDSMGRVLLHSDATKNLSENIIAETGGNERLQNCIRFKNDDLVNDVPLYGASCVFGVTPLKGGPLSLVVFYNKNLLYDNVLRFLHFSIESLIYLYLMLALCIIFSTGINEKPSKLRFNIRKIEWIRPSCENQKSYYYTKWFFGTFGVLVAISFYITIHFHLDLRIIYCISLLMPLYSILGFILFRLKEIKLYENKNKITGTALVGQPGTEPVAVNPGLVLQIKTKLKEMWKWISTKLEALWRWIRARMVTVIFILLVNLIIFIFLGGAFHYNNTFFVVAMFQLKVIAILAFYYYRLHKSMGLARQEEQEEQKTEPQKNSNDDPEAIAMQVQDEKASNEQQPAKQKSREVKLNKKVRKDYLASLYHGMVLIAILPAIGIITYGYQAEKIQFKKNKQLGIAAAYQQRNRFVSNELVPDYKKDIADSMIGEKYFDSIKFHAGIYLSDNDTVRPVPGNQPGSVVPFRLCDEPYASMMDNFFLFSALDFKSYSVKNASRDSSWIFSSDEPSPEQHLRLLSNNNVNGNLPGESMEVISAIHGPLTNFLSLGTWVKLFTALCVFIMALLSYWLIRSAINRLFLLDYISSHNVINVNEQFLDRHLKYTSIRTPWFKEPVIPAMVTQEFFKPGSLYGDKKWTDDDCILAMTNYFKDTYEAIWSDLSHGEQYFVFDFADDGFTNYKDSDTLFKLINKGIIIQQPDKFVLFSPSFRQFLLSKKGSEEIKKLKAENASPGFWSTVRIPLLIFISVTAIFIFATQQDFSRQLTAILTSAIALPAVIMKFVEMINARSSGNK